MVHFFGGHVSTAKPLLVHVPEGMVLTVVSATISSGASAVLSVETTGLDNSLVKVALCTLRAKTTDQVKLDVVFGATKTKLSVVGDGVVHLAGYYQPGPPEESVGDHAEAINKLTVDDLQELIQKAAARIAHNDELAGEPHVSKKRPRQPQAEEPTAQDDDEASDAETTPTKKPSPSSPKKNKSKKKVLLSTPN
ncbi:hypothetical protein SPRG_09286 [Saprolegnia parasitica CBS 223.65]|uniref:Nucleoplasmin-like domain-containing protein n=1 Tax=Saprolegnia parasitica (strain CBS 223.65) TaxID=695850 RepID=A0A067C3Q0_SAPPC|nr:hypothetical protein SPRG_09286 [Saprolegnia parasitica CBS 223.65]KDO25138.1 hypothetical protein SPRG_09286 [Saprolegnia parasitica CBS 223.65]|eukprot:XP_012204207.1 hypothetical protein SPRG_09286 [Saprolegnia parasitica CBS 223.65]